MKIAHLTYDMRIGGTEKVIANLVSADNTIGLNQEILCLEAPIGPFGEALIKTGVKVSGWHRRDGFDWRLVFKLRHYIRTNHINILHCHQYTPWCYGALACIGLSTQVVFTEHGRFYPDYASPKRRWINPLLAKITARITAISQATSQALVEYEYLTQQNIEVIYNGLATNNIGSASAEMLSSIPKDHIVFGTVARFDPIKNHPLMIKAFADYTQLHPNSYLVLVGDGETKDELMDLVTELGISEQVLFTGYHTDPSAFLARFDVFLLTSFSEGTSMTLLEAMHYKKPAIVTNVGGNPEIIKHSVSGLVIPNKDQTALLQAMLTLSDKDTQQIFGEAAYHDFQHRFTASVMQSQYHQLYQQLEVALS